MGRVCLLNIVGLTPAHVGEHTPNLLELARAHGARPLAGVLPAVTLSAQATMLTGAAPATHGVVANGWLYRDTMEIRLWQQARSLLQAPALYDLARARAQAAGRDFTAANIFWWFNQGAGVDFSLTPKPWYGCDGDKVFGVHGSPPGFAAEAVRTLGEFPFHTFWGPLAGLPSSQWIARAAQWVLRAHAPDLTLVYLPLLDYDLQRFGPACEHLPRLLEEVDACAGDVIAAARAARAEVVVVSEYGLAPVSRPVHINRLLRSHGLLTVRDGPFGEGLDTFQSRAFALADHQLAHVYVRAPEDLEPVRSLLLGQEGVSRVLGREERAREGLDHPRSGELVALAAADAWFTYYYWLDDARAPDFARTVDIHRKPGYDPCELFFDPALAFPRLTTGLKLLRKKLGMRYRLDVIPLDATLVRGSHGLPPASPDQGPVFISSAPPPSTTPGMRDLRDYVLGMLASG